MTSSWKKILAWTCLIAWLCNDQIMAVEWVTMTSTTVDMSCKYKNTSTCCGLLDRADPSQNVYPYYNPRREYEMTSIHQSKDSRLHKPKCHTTREYISSPYELEHLKRAEDISKLPNLDARRPVLTEFIVQDIPHTNKWLRRIAVRMNDSRTVHEKRMTPPHPDDLQYLSRYNTTTTCNGISHSWIEWIEPLSVHARHPNSLIQYCPRLADVSAKHKSEIEFPVPSISAMDYILLQHYDDFHLSKLSHKTINPKKGPRKYFFDAGANYFITGTAWTTCAYLQRGIDFDHIYAVEYVTLDPVKYFDMVPPKLIPFIHLMNVPASHNRSQAGSVMRMIDQMVTPQDFVAFKLYIDTTDIEIPIFLELLNNTRYSDIIDEFFFELHFRGEFMDTCGWGADMPEVFGDLRLFRHETLQSFLKLRQRGMRAHIWP